MVTPASSSFPPPSSPFHLFPSSSHSPLPSPFLISLLSPSSPLLSPSSLPLLSLPQLKNADYFSQYVTEDFEQYVNRKRNDHSYGNNLEMQAMAEMYNRTIEVHQYSIGTYNSMVYTVWFRARDNYNALQTFPTQLLGVV